MDLDQLADLDSFTRVHDYLSRETQIS